VIGPFKNYPTDVSRDWEKWENCVLSCVILSPPISLDIGEEGFMEDWVVIEIDESKVDSTNFVGNVIDHGTTIPSTSLRPHLARGIG